MSLATPATPEADTLWAAIYAAIQPGLLRWLRGRMRDPDEAEDCCQEAFVRLLCELRAGRVPDAPVAWVWRVARNLLVSRARHARIVARAAGMLARAEGEDLVEVTVVARERFTSVWQALARLPVGERGLILLAPNGAGAQRLADELGISPGAARRGSTVPAAA